MSLPDRCSNRLFRYLRVRSTKCLVYHGADLHSKYVRFPSHHSARYLYELGIPGVGENVDVASGFAIFFRKSLGGVAVGVFFGLALLFILTRLDRRFNREENVVEVTATMAIAYVGYYVAEPVWQTSGVIATLTAGVLVKFLGRAVINDAKLLNDFWTLVRTSHCDCFGCRFAV